MSAVTDGVATIEGRLARPAAIVGVPAMSRLRRLRLGHVLAHVPSVISRGRSVPVGWQRMPHGVRVGTDNAGQHQRKHGHGCKQPHLPRIGDAAHLERLRLLPDYLWRPIWPTSRRERCRRCGMLKADARRGVRPNALPLLPVRKVYDAASAILSNALV